MNDDDDLEPVEPREAATFIGVLVLFATIIAALAWAVGVRP